MTKRDQRKQRKAGKRNTCAYREKRSNIAGNLSEMNPIELSLSSKSDKRKQAGRKKMLKNRNAAAREILKLKSSLQTVMSKAERYKKRYQRLVNKNAVGLTPSPMTKVRKILKGRTSSLDVRKKDDKNHNSSITEKIALDINLILNFIFTTI